MKLLAITLLVTIAAFGPVGAEEPESPIYLPAASVNAEALIEPPTERGSAAYKAEMKVVLWLQRSRTPQQIAFVREELNLARFVPLIGEDLLTVDGIALHQILDHVIDQVRADYDRLKDVYDMPRPFQVSDAIHPVTEARPVASYPSGHAIRATVYARLLGEIFPSRHDALMAYAMQIGYGRVIAGVHFPMDVLAGQKLGNAYADVIVAQPAFTDAMRRISQATDTVSLPASGSR